LLSAAGGVMSRCSSRRSSAGCSSRPTGS
jgi:hypothetical protein